MIRHMAGVLSALGVCSASNYLLGLTPLQYPPFIVGSVGGMAVWAVIYASIGGAGRTLLQSGVSLNDVFAGVLVLSSALSGILCSLHCGPLCPLRSCLIPISHRDPNT